ncbi:MAG: hypothetical protein E7319_04075 [Clostridiales bacterium]|nr:hypothetical protein [Clostridiales bacterium]
MFGYVTIAPEGLSQEGRDRYRACYCGLCRTLGRRYGSLSRLTLSYDLTFLFLLLNSLYEPGEESAQERCALHPLKPHAYVCNEIADYCADMNIALSYHKCLDNWQDDRSLLGRGEAALLEKAYQQVKSRYPEKCGQLENCLSEIRQVEMQEATLDGAANLTAQMLGVIYRYRDDYWADTLAKVGECMGRFIYLMDAYEDLPADLRKKRYNPLTGYHQNEDYEAFVHQSLMMLIAECTEAFETLPLVKDMDILRNILYGGCWMRYHALKKRREKDKPAVVREGKGMQ